MAVYEEHLSFLHGYGLSETAFLRVFDSRNLFICRTETQGIAPIPEHLCPDKVD